MKRECSVPFYVIMLLLAIIIAMTLLARGVFA